MATEAHKLIGISLSKIAQSRASRGGVSLHKNLLVATVLHKARYIFMEEAYHIVHGNGRSDNGLTYPPYFDTTSPKEDGDSNVFDDENNKIKNGDDFPSDWDESGDDLTTRSLVDDQYVEFEEPSVPEPVSYKNSPPPSYQAHIELTYLNLDASSTNNNNSTSESEVITESHENNTLKRRHTEWELEEAVLSILPSPKRTKSDSDEEDGDDFVFLDDPDFLSSNSENKENRCEIPETKQDETPPASMEIDRLSSLVSIFSFSNLAEANNSSGSGPCGEDNSANKSNVSNPDLCSAQAKDISEVLQPIPYLAMTV